MSQPLSWPSLPSFGFSRAPRQLSQLSGGISTRVRGAWPIRPRWRRQESSSPALRACPLGTLARVTRSTRPQRSEASVLGSGDPLPEGRGAAPGPWSWYQRR